MTMQALFFANVRAHCDIECPRTQKTLDAMAAANWQDRSRMLLWLQSISRRDLCDAILCAWGKIPLEHATGKTKHEWLALLKPEPPS